MDLAKRPFARMTAAILVGAVLANCGSGDSLAYDERTAVHGQFSGAKAFEHVDRLVALGPRPPGSEAIELSRQYIEKQLAAVGWRTSRQTFQSRTPVGAITFSNVRARFGGAEVSDEALWKRPVSVVVGSHYDTKFYRNMIFVGANDAGSSTGLLIEMARVLAARPPLAQEIELVFFDGEEAYVRYTPTDGLFGSRQYQKMVRKMPAEVRPRFGVIFDMVGDRELNIALPSNASNDLARMVFAAADELGVGSHFGLRGSPILDDHVPLANAGLEVTNFIDLDYEPWHTAEDTMDKITAESLEMVGKVGVLFLEKYLLGGHTG